MSAPAPPDGAPAGPRAGTAGSAVAPIRLLLVDDSASVRAVLRRFFAGTTDIEVVGEALDGSQAVAAVMQLQPDVVVMDLQMPVMDGYTAIEQIMARRPTPIVVLSSRANRNQIHTGFEAIRRGALEVLPKPEDTASWHLLAEALPETVRGIAQARPAGIRAPRTASSLTATGAFPRVDIAATELGIHSLRWVAIGASTGGPLALRELLGGIPAEPPVSFLVVQHIAEGFDLGLVEWLNKELPLDVRLAVAGERPRPGAVRLGPTGRHLRLGADGEIELDGAAPPRRGHRPSADDLFFSCALAAPRYCAGVLLTGMGADGAEGLGALREAGGLTLAQDEASCAVYGMPRVALERGAAQAALPPRELARALTRCWRREST